MTPDQYCRDKVTQAGSSLYYAILFLPSPTRRALNVLYAFHRELVDISISCSDASVARAKLGWWYDELNRMVAGSSRHPISQALQLVIEQYDLEPEQLTELFEGVQMAIGQLAYDSLHDLELNARRTAGVTSVMAAQICGYQDAQTTEYAKQIGTAIALAESLQNTRQDAMRGHINLPHEKLRQFSVPRDAIRMGEQSGQVKALFSSHARHIREKIHEASALLPECDRYPQRSSVTMSEIHSTALRAIERGDLRFLERPGVLSPLRKLWIAWYIHQRAMRQYRKQSNRAR